VLLVALTGYLLWRRWGRKPGLKVTPSA
jgi:hypothetical protein